MICSLYVYSYTAPFSVESGTGDLVLTQTLDYETKTLYSFTVNVSDNGEEPRMDSAMVGIWEGWHCVPCDTPSVLPPVLPSVLPPVQVSVVVEDVNDNPPRFQNDSYYVAIPERNYSTQNQIITQVSI